ncbi:hypothetical protein K501DRAFT_100454 [Backusella circina FSU 941]|nr:hypothetical protein K501DRAFT_100454 [Backusella circina FSU 941]
MSISNPKNSRAKRGCDLCRKRKTRCDCYIQLPCSKCRKAKTACTFLVDQKKRGPINGSYVASLEYRIEQMEKLIKRQASSMEPINLPEIAYQQHTPKDNVIIKQKQHHTSIHESSESPSLLLTDSIALNHQVFTDLMAPENDKNLVSDNNIIPTLVGGSNDTPSYTNAPSPTFDRDFDMILEEMNGLTIRDYQRTRYIGYSLGLQCLRANLFCSNRKHRLSQEPSWFVQKINHDEEEHVIMKTKEAFQPQFLYHEPTLERFKMLKDPCMTDALADFLIHVFFTRVHQYYPVVNKIQFLEQYYFQNPCPPDKFLLWTIISIGAKVAQVWTSDIDNFNYTTDQLQDVHQRFSQLARGILSLVHQRSMISTVQTLLLLSMLVHEEKNEDEDTSHWVVVGLAIRLAYDLGLHLDCSDWHIPSYEMEQRRRIFWLAYMTDRRVSAQQGRPLTIIDGQFDVQDPAAYEVGTTHRTRTHCTPVLILEAEIAKEQSLPVYNVFKEMIGLHRALSKVLTHFYNRFTRVRDIEKAVELYGDIDRELKAWWASIPNDCKSGPLHNAGTDTVHFRINYYCVCLLLHRPFTRIITSISEHAIDVCNRYSDIIISMAEEIDKEYLVTLPWCLTTYSLFQATLIYAYNVNSPDPKTRESSIDYLFRCSKIYKKDPNLQKTCGSLILLSILSNIDSITVEEYNDEEYRDDGNHEECQDIYEVEKKNSFLCKTICEHVKIASEQTF